MFNQKEYNANYHKTKCKQIKLLLNNEKDKDVIEFLESKTNVNGFLKALIRKEIEQQKKE